MTGGPVATDAAPVAVAPGAAERGAGVAAPLFALGVFGLWALTLFFPIFQLFKTGVIYYENGPDEASYLQYEFSRLTQSMTRPGQYLVSALHELGLSGAWINMLFDSVAVVGFPLMVRAVLRRLGWTGDQANAGALLAMVFPQVVLLSNPIVDWLQALNVRSGWLYWFNLPGVHFSPLWRSPEPQFSLMLLAIAVWAALRWRKFAPVYGVLPFLYPFVAIPAAFVTLACHLHARWPFARAAATGPLLASFLAISAACGAYYAFLVPAKTQLLVVASHLPLISFSGLVALAAYGLLRQAIAPEHRFVALAAAIAPWVGANQQLLSGHIPQPDSFEQYVGCLAVALVVALGVRTRPWLQWACLLVGGVLFLSASYHTFRVCQAYMIRLPVTSRLLDDLKTDSRDVVVNDPFLASLFGMIYPKQTMTALAFERTFVATADRYVGEYRCLKRQLMAERPGVFDHSFRLLDEAYEYGSQKYIMAHINRKTDFVKLQDVSPAGCQDPTRRPLRYHVIVWNPYEPSKSRMPAKQ